MGGHHKKEPDTKHHGKKEKHPANPAHNKHPESHEKHDPTDPAAEKPATLMGVNVNLTKRDLKMIEKLHAKIEYLEARGEDQEAEKVRQQITTIEEHSNAKAAKKGENMTAATK